MNSARRRRARKEKEKETLLLTRVYLEARATRLQEPGTNHQHLPSVKELQTVSPITTLFARLKTHYQQEYSPPQIQKHGGKAWVTLYQGYWRGQASALDTVSATGLLEALSALRLCCLVV